MNQDIFEFFKKQSLPNKIAILVVAFFIGSAVIQGFYRTYFVSPYPEFNRSLEKARQSTEELERQLKKIEEIRKNPQ